jgi:drug/metabolite transporter (DMT)-like permease
MKHLTRYAGPFDVVFGRYLVAFVALLALMLLNGRSLKFPPLKLSLGVAVFQTAGMQCFCQLALMSGGAGKVVLLAYTMPFWVIGFAWVLLGDRPSRRHFMGFAAAAVGLLCVIAPWNGLGSISGSLFALAGGMSWGFGVVLSKMMFQRYSPDVLAMTTWQMFLGAVLTLPLAIFMPQPALRLEPGFWWGMLYTGIVASAVGWWLWMSVVRRVSASVVGMCSLGVPVLTVLFAWILLGEQPGTSEYLGIVFILGGLLVVNLPVRRRA